MRGREGERVGRKEMKREMGQGESVRVNNDSYGRLFPHQELHPRQLVQDISEIVLDSSPGDLVV